MVGNKNYNVSLEILDHRYIITCTFSKSDSMLSFLQIATLQHVLFHQLTIYKILIFQHNKSDKDYTEAQITYTRTTYTRTT